MTSAINICLDAIIHIPNQFLDMNPSAPLNDFSSNASSIYMDLPVFITGQTKVVTSINTFVGVNVPCANSSRGVHYVTAAAQRRGPRPSPTSAKC